MQYTTNFNDWLKYIKLSDHNILFELYTTVSSTSSCGNFNIRLQKYAVDKWDVYEVGSDFALSILSEKARQTFLKILDSNTPDSIGVEDDYFFKNQWKITTNNKQPTLYRIDRTFHFLSIKA